MNSYLLLLFIIFLTIFNYLESEKENKEKKNVGHFAVEASIFHSKWKDRIVSSTD